MLKLSSVLVNLGENMSDDMDILRKIPDTGHREPALDVNAEEFEKIVNSRRSVRVYEEGVKIPDEIIDKCLDIALKAPNSSNLQPWEFYWVKSPDKLKKLQELCMSQAAARTAPTIIVAVARLDTWNRNRQEMIAEFKREEEKTGKPVPKGAYTYYNKISKLAYNQGIFGLFGCVKRIFFAIKRIKGEVVPGAPTSKSDMRVWAHKSTALACENLMLAFRAYGYDSCPMEGLDHVRVKRLLGLYGEKAEICMAISAGKRAENGVYGRQIRFKKDWFVKEL